MISSALSLLVGAVAAVVTFTPLWRLQRLFVTAIHELGHAVVATATGADVRAMNVRLDTSGVTEWANPHTRRRTRAAVVAAAGYPAPAVVAILAAIMVSWYPWVFAYGFAAVLVVATLRWGRSVFSVMVLMSFAGMLAVSGLFAATAGVAWSAGMLSAGAVRSALEHHRQRLEAGSDASMLSSLLKLPPAAFSLMALLACCACLAFTGWLAVTRW